MTSEALKPANLGFKPNSGQFDMWWLSLKIYRPKATTQARTAIFMGWM